MASDRRRRTKENQRRIVQSAVNHRFGIRQQLLGRQRAESFGQCDVLGLAGLGDPATAKVFDGGRIETGQRQTGTLVRRKIVTAFGENLPQPFLVHFDQAVFFPHPVTTVVLDRNAHGTRRDMEHQHSATGWAIGVQNLLEVDGQRNLFAEPFASSFGLFERPRSDDFPGPFIRDAQDDLAAPFVGQRRAILTKLRERKPVRRHLELAALVFLAPQPGFELSDSGWVDQRGHSSPSTSKSGISSLADFPAAFFFPPPFTRPPPRFFFSCSPCLTSSA